jgi:hypothetical protein
VYKSFNYRSTKFETCPIAHDDQETQRRSLGTLKLSRVQFSDNEHDAMDAVDDPKSSYYEINETVKKQKVSTQSTKMIEAFWQKYHTKLGDDDEVQAIMPEFTRA